MPSEKGINCMTNTLSVYLLMLMVTEKNHHGLKGDSILNVEGTRLDQRMVFLLFFSSKQRSLIQKCYGNLRLCTWSFEVIIRMSITDHFCVSLNKIPNQQQHRP